MIRVPFRILLGGAALAAGVARAQEPAKPAEPIGRRIERLVEPAAKSGAALRAEPLALPGPRAVERPELPSPIYKGAFPPIGPAARKPVLPAPPREGPPLADMRGQPVLPEAVVLPTAPLVRVIAADPNVPGELPILATPKMDRAPLTDPTLEASVAAVLEKKAPPRVDPAPLPPQNLPDPFENIRVGALRNPPPEDSQPPVIPVQTPRR